jgi:hypothetical protein
MRVLTYLFNQVPSMGVLGSPNPASCIRRRPVRCLVNALRLAGIRTSPTTCCQLHEYALQCVRMPIQQSHYERVYEVTITLRETSQSRCLQVDQALDQTTLLLILL